MRQDYVLDSQSTQYIEEYIELLKNSDKRFEYFDGEVVSNAGGKIVHGDIPANIVRHLGNRLEGSPCRISSSDVAVKVAHCPTFSLSWRQCGLRRRVIEEFLGIEMIVNPMLIIEALSPTHARNETNGCAPISRV